MFCCSRDSSVDILLAESPAALLYVFRQLSFLHLRMLVEGTDSNVNRRFLAHLIHLPMRGAIREAFEKKCNLDPQNPRKPAIALREPELLSVVQLV